jgi:CheY-like chemotaxis protein
MTAAHILVVDDEPGVRHIAVRILREAGYEVTEATDGGAALSLVTTARGAFDLVVSDIVMPVLTGVELAGHLSLSAPDVPVLLMSGFATSDLMAQGIAAPCGVLAKPFTADELLREVHRCLAGRREPAA